MKRIDGHDVSNSDSFEGSASVDNSNGGEICENGEVPKDLENPENCETAPSEPEVQLNAGRNMENRENIRFDNRQIMREFCIYQRAYVAYMNGIMAIFGAGMVDFRRPAPINNRRVLRRRHIGNVREPVYRIIDLGVPLYEMPIENPVWICFLNCLMGTFIMLVLFTLMKYMFKNYPWSRSLSE